MAVGASLRLRLVARYLKLAYHPTTDVTQLRREYFGRAYPAPAPITRSLRARSDIRETRVLDRPVYTLRLKRRASDWHIVYTHGGGYVSPIAKPHWDGIEALMRSTGATVTVPMYPHAPEHHYKDAYRQLRQIYETLLLQVVPERIILCGDSAGGGLALGQALFYRDQGLVLPGHIVLFSPWLDATVSNPDARALELNDIMLRANVLREEGRWWADPDDPHTPLVSPIFGDLRNLPPIQVYIGTNDMFLPDARKLRELVSAAGGRIDLHETPGGFHVFMQATFTPEAKRVYHQVRSSLVAHAM
jgi:acetyl esterase/lipase